MLTCTSAPTEDWCSCPTTFSKMLLETKKFNTHYNQAKFYLLVTGQAFSLKIQGGPKMARSPFPRPVICRNVAEKWDDACLSARRATYGLYRPPLDGPKMARLK